MKRLSLILAIIMIVSVMTMNAYAADIDVAYDEYLAAASEYNGNHYLFINEPCTWPEAKAYCEELGGHLVTITSAGEDDFCYQLWYSSGASGCYLGASDADREGTWKWITGEEWSYSNWGSGDDDWEDQPDNANGGEDYASQSSRNFPYGRWNDISADYSYPFICEWEKEDLKRDSLGADGDYSNISVPGAIELYDLSEVISVNLSWNIPVFTYTEKLEWNNTDLAYNSKSYEWSTTPADITVENRSNLDIEASFDFTTTLTGSGIDGEFTSDEMGEMPITNDAIALESAAKNRIATSETVYFFITDGTLPKTHEDGAVIGNITITIAKLENN